MDQHPHQPDQLAASCGLEPSEATVNDYIPARIYEIIISGLGAVVVYFLVRIHKQITNLAESYADMRLLIAERCVMKEDHELEHNKERALLDASIEQRLKITKLECIKELKEAK